MSGSSRRRTNLVDRVAMELRQIEAEEIAGDRYDLSAAETWERAGEVLRAGYRSDARRLLKVMQRQEARP
jgi:hypothetical protein